MQNVSLATSAMLVEMSISCWQANKIDRSVTDEVNTSKQASRTAAKVSKNLLADDVRLARLVKYAAEVRHWVYSRTLPWNDFGGRIISTAQFFDFKNDLDAHKARFDAMVDDFVQAYPTLISAQAFKLGTMFDRSEFPDPSEVASKFRMRYAFVPLPTAGDFRVDVADDIAAALREQYEVEFNERTKAMQDDLWGRVTTMLDKVHDRLGADDGKNRIFRDSLVDNALELCDLLSVINVTKDPKLDEVSHALRNTLKNVTPKELRTNDAVRADVRSQVEELRNRFTF